MSDQSCLAPDTVITGPVWDMWPTIEAAVKQVQAGVYTAQDFGSFSFMAKGGAKLAPMHDWDKKLPADVKELVDTQAEGDPRRQPPRQHRREHAGVGVGRIP